MQKVYLFISWMFVSWTSLFAQKNIDKQFFDEVDTFFNQYVQDGAIDYASLKNETQLGELIQWVETAKIDDLDAQSLQAFYINAYNLLVIKGIVEAYPIASVLDKGGFFDAKKYLVAAEKVSLNQLEKDKLLKEYADPRLHFVLVCGAKGCPPITNFAYRPEKLMQQLTNQTKKAVNDEDFIRLDEVKNSVHISAIFDWYAKDFGGGKQAILRFINQYRTKKIDEQTKVRFYEYDWSLNDFANNENDEKSLTKTTDNNAQRYVVSAVIPKGTVELKLFNNLYTQRTGDGVNLHTRSTFFTTSLSFLYGIHPRLNVGFDLRYRRVKNSALPSSPFSVLGGLESGTGRQGITNFGPKIRLLPSTKLPNFSIQSQWWIATANDLEGTNSSPYIDWNNASWLTQLFYDKSIGTQFSVFAELDFFLEDIGDFNRFSTPLTGIFSYFPSPKSTLYALGSYAPIWQENFDYYWQVGMGAKYQISPHFEIELLYTAFSNEFLKNNNGNAATYNIGFRFSR